MSSPARIDPTDLQALPIFPLPGTVLLPHTEIALHVFEPRYRRMLDDVMDGPRLLGMATLDHEGDPDRFDRPPVFPIAGVGIVRRSVRLPDGRYNIVLEGAIRADISEELDPSPSVPYRRVIARQLADKPPDDATELDEAVTAVRALCTRVVADMAGGPTNALRRLNEVHDGGALADMVAAAVIHDLGERQRILTELDVMQRLQLAAGAIGELVIRSDEASSEPTPVGWGVGTGKA